MTRPPRSRRPLILVAVALAAAAVVWWLDVPTFEAMRRWSESTGPWFPLVFFAAYVGFTQLPVPRTVFTLSAGMLFGAVPGMVMALAATGVSAITSLFVVRHFARDWAREMLMRNRRIMDLDRRLERRGWLAVASLRMIAAVPFAPLNYACALSSIRPRPFFLATVVGSAPGTIATVLLGDALAGDMDVRLLAVTVLLVCVGVTGLIIDARTPVVDSVKSGR
ncbi:TVP38/TMEM64 family protein [uncultured Corynebacterium sp.]|uniref:TVP38/TMEM64 family protein n=1 Tax=uncultured Corynebacterium sp. TaxID=159447 RepID=UPI0025F190D5|nr:TVP38/TMEM64 family protein [uncultured Corynebacterium sp.]